MRTTTTGSTRRSRLTTGAVGAFAAILLAAWVALSADPASAATSGVQLSDDGVHFSATYSGSLFDSAALMVPQSTQTGSFWVKNASPDPAYLRVSVGSVTGGGNAFSGALTVAARIPSGGGTHVGVDAALPCYVLAQGQLLAPGAVVRIDATLALADLTGTTGQASNVGFDILVGLSSAATGSMPATTCLGNSGSVPGTPGGTGGSGGSGGGGAHPGGTGSTGGSGTPADPGTTGSADGGLDLPDTPDGSAFEGENQSAGILRSNTGRFLQEWFVFAWVFGAVAGGGLQILVARRREYEYEYAHDDDEEVTAWQVDGRRFGRKAWSTTSVSV